MEGMRTTIEMKPEHRAKLLEMAARRGEKGFSSIIADAIEAHLNDDSEREMLGRRALRVRGKLGAREADRLRRHAEALRRSWR